MKLIPAGLAKDAKGDVDYVIKTWHRFKSHFLCHGSPDTAHPTHGLVFFRNPPCIIGVREDAQIFVVEKKRDKDW